MRYRAALIASAILWSTSFPLIKYALKGGPPLTLLFYRFFFASLGILIIVRKNSIKELLFPNIIIPSLGLFNALGFVFQFEGQALTTASRAALLVNLYVVFVAVLAKFLLGEKIGKNKIFAIFTAVLGASLISTGWNPEIIYKGHIKGDILVSLAGFTWSFYIVFSKKVSPFLEPMKITGGVMLWTFTILLFLAFPLKKIAIPTKETVFFAAYLGIFCSVVPYSLYVYSLKKISASISALFLLLEVVLSLIWSWIFLEERFSSYEFIGALIIIFSLYLGGKEEVTE